MEDGARPVGLLVPSSHPDWQGSVPSRWMDRSTGCIRGLPRAGPPDGSGSPLVEALDQRPAPAPLMPFWAPEREARWNPCRRVCDAPPPKEPDRLTQQPPYVPRKGRHIRCPEAQELPPFFDAGVERFKVEKLQKERRRLQRAAVMERRTAQGMVRGLEDWEREHLLSGSATRSAGRSMTRLPLAGSTSRQSTGPLWRSASDANFEFCRPQAA